MPLSLIRVVRNAKNGVFGRPVAAERYNIIVSYYYHYSLNADDEECDNDGVAEEVQSAQFGCRNDFSRFLFCYLWGFSSWFFAFWGGASSALSTHLTFCSLSLIKIYTLREYFHQFKIFKNMHFKKYRH